MRIIGVAIMAPRRAPREAKIVEAVLSVVLDDVALVVEVLVDVDVVVEECAVPLEEIVAVCLPCWSAWSM